MAKGRDPYAKTCPYVEDGQQFGEPFQCTEKIDHKGSHYDEFLKMWAPRVPAERGGQ